MINLVSDKIYSGDDLMWKRFLVSVSLLNVFANGALAQDANGVWRTEATDQGYLEVQIAPCGSNLCGQILRARDLSGKAQPYPHTGRQMIWDMQPNGSGSWRRGKIWDPRNDRTFNAKMELAGGQLKVSGCVLGICDSQTWRRVN